jgi:elongation factor G
LAFCSELTISEAKQRSAALEAFYKERGYVYKQDLPLVTRVVRAVFGARDRRRISTYSLVLRQAQKEDIMAINLAAWIEERGGVQEITLARSANYVSPKDKAGQVNFSKALNRFTKEDPTFQVYRDEESGETIIKGMGELHLEIYIERIKREYGCEVNVGRPKVAFREAMTQRADFNYTHKKQTGGSGQFARVGGFIEPLPSDAIENYEFVDDIVGGVIPREFIPACDKGFREVIREGSLIGQPVVGVRVTINDGADHPVDSSEMAFKVASISAFREAYMKAKPIILEPIMKLEVSVPEEFQGVCIGQINQRRGVIVGTTMDAGYVVVESDVPLSEMFGYSTDIRSVTQGKGEFSMEFLRYAPVPKNVQEEMVKVYQAKRAEGRN